MRTYGYRAGTKRCEPPAVAFVIYCSGFGRLAPELWRFGGLLSALVLPGQKEGDEGTGERGRDRVRWASSVEEGESTASSFTSSTVAWLGAPLYVLLPVSV